MSYDSAQEDIVDTSPLHFSRSKLRGGSVSESEGDSSQIPRHIYRYRIYVITTPVITGVVQRVWVHRTGVYPKTKKIKQEFSQESLVILGKTGGNGILGKTEDLRQKTSKGIVGKTED